MGREGDGEERKRPPGVIYALPVLETDRLRLRPFTLADAPEVRVLAGAREVAATTMNLPHPYPQGLAEEWIGGHAENAARGESFTFAITRKSDDALLGCISVGVTVAHRRGELGYWLGVPFWNQGYTGEAARRVTGFCFEQLGLNRVQASCFPRNVASARVMEKAGLTYEGTLREFFLKGDTFEDVAVYALLRSDFKAR